MNFLPVSLSSYSLATVIFHILVPRSSPRWRLIGLDKRRARESVSVAVLQPEASRIALSKSDGNAEAHASICNQCVRRYFSRNIVPNAR